MYKVNPNSYASVFALPTQIADKYLRLAGKAQLKVLLWLYRNPAADADIASISRDTGIPADEIDDAMLYWIDAGLVIKDGEMPKVNAEAVISGTEKLRQSQVTEPVKTAEVPVKKEKPPVVKPSIKDIARRLGESAEISSMFNEAEEVFGRTLGYDAQSSLLILHDHYALPAEVIIMICSYAKTIGKQGSLAYIMKMGVSWAESGINTFESASEKIVRMENADKLWLDFRMAAGLENPKPTSKQSEFLEIWVNDYGFDTDIISLAYERAVEKKGSINFGYMNGILRSWHESGYKTVEDIERAEREFAGEAEKKRKNAAKKSSKSDPPSYDAELVLQRSYELDPTKTKKGQ